MSKRKLSRQQRWRIEKVQAEREQRAQRKQAVFEESIGEGSLGAEQTGLIVSHFGQQVEVEGEHQLRQRCHVRSEVGDLVTGDRVTWRAGNPTGVVEARSQRQSLLSRPDAYGKLKPVAANIDRMLIVIAARPQPHFNLIDRYLVAAENAGIAPLLLLNKHDLIDDANRAALTELLALYQGIGYDVVTASTKTVDGLDELKARLRGRVSVFVGQSGVGKSSLVNALLPGSDIRVGALSEGTDKGRHTTTTARLYHFPGGGSLIDSPGIREFALGNLSWDDVLDGFVEFRSPAGRCRFRDCRHQQEPGCALLQAVADGEVDAQRLASFRQIVASLGE